MEPVDGTVVDESSGCSGVQQEWEEQQRVGRWGEHWETGSPEKSTETDTECTEENRGRSFDPFRSASWGCLLPP